MYMAASGLPVIHGWSVVILHEGFSTSGPSKLTTSINRVDHKESAIV